MYNTDIGGVPYFPGVAIGTLHRGMPGALRKRIVLLTQNEISVCTCLPEGFVIVDAAPFSHNLITLLGLGVPTVLISGQQAASLKEGMTLLIDGISGRITTNIRDGLDVSSVVEEDYRPQQAGQSVLMADGEPVNLCASVRRPSAANQAVVYGAKAIGLVRSEFLLPMNGRLPNVSFYRGAFREVCEAASPLPVTFRLLDVAADKIPPWLPRSGALGGGLGLQGVRLYNMAPVETVLTAQLEALSDLADEFVLRLLIPFLVRVEEYEYWQGVLREQLPVQFPVGAMAETPATVLDIGNLLARADFVAIGCNDLMQSFFTADRDQAELCDYLDAYAPVLYRLFRQVAEQAGQQVKDIQLCGVLAQMQGVLPVLLGLGFRTFSVDAPFIPHLVNILAATTYAECKALAAQVCAARTTREVLETLQLPTDRHPPFLI